MLSSLQRLQKRLTNDSVGSLTFRHLRFAGGRQPERSPLLEDVSDSPVSDYFEQAVNQAIQELPAFAQAELVKNGWRVKVSRFLTDAFPFLKGLTPRGWDKRRTWDRAVAVSNVQLKEIGVAEYCKEMLEKPGGASPFAQSPKSPRVIRRVAAQGDEVIYKNDMPARVLRHEVGHALDRIYGISRRRGFQRAYGRDLKNMGDLNRMYYYTQPNSRGKATESGSAETCAEAFAALFGGGCVYVSVFKTYFAETMRYMQRFFDRKELAYQHSA